MREAAAGGRSGAKAVRERVAAAAKAGTEERVVGETAGRGIAESGVWIRFLDVLASQAYKDMESGKQTVYLSEGQ
jgi:hypothetical protein